MMQKSKVWALVSALVVACLMGSTATAQITTGTIAGTVKDATGGVLPGASVVLISETKNTRSAPAVTNASGDFIFPNITPDTYTIEVTMPSFRTLKRAGVQVSGGSRVAIPAMELQAGGTTEVVNVTAEAPLIQAQSGERSFAVSSTQVDNLPINHGNFTSLTALVPGVVAGGASAGGTRVGGASQNNIMMDGISAMDTGNNGQMLAMNVESIAEVKVLTQGYQAEYGRSSGLQITAVTKSGSNRFHGSGYWIRTDSKWNANSWANEQNGVAKSRVKTTTEGYTIGGPVGKPGGNNKLFFFHSYEFRPTSQPINTTNGVTSPIRFRLPTAAERAGDFSNTLDNNGNKVFIKDPLINGTCSATVQTACFPGGIIPANRLYAPGLALLNRYPLPNITQAPSTNYNYEQAVADLPVVDNLVRQPAVRVDYQFSPSLRVTGKYSGQRATKLITPGSLQGFNDVLNPYPFITNYGLTANYTLNPTTFIEATYGFIRNQLAGGGSGGILTNPTANRLDPANGLTNLPLIYPDAGLVDTRYYAYTTMQDLKPSWWDGSKINLPQQFGWGSLIGAAPPNQLFPGFLNINRTQDFAASVTKVEGRHTIKGGFYNNHSYKAQNVGAGGIANLSFQGFIDFGNSSTNPLDSGFGYANAALGNFTQYVQASRLIEGSMLYNNTEFYLQDNWKVNSRLTLDYGMRFTHQQPQYDQFLQMSNFFASGPFSGAGSTLWSPSAAPALYVFGCSNGAVTCSGTTRTAKNPITGQVLPPGQGFLAGTPVPNTGNLFNGIAQAGQGISQYSYTWPTLVYGPRFGAAYDLTGTQSIVIRGGGGMFYDRPDGNTIFSIPGNPQPAHPELTSNNLFNASLSQIGTVTALPAPQLTTFQYNAAIPTSIQWNAGVQMALPWSSSLDISYVGNHGKNLLGAFQGGTAVNLNAVDFGTAYLPSSQDPTVTSSVPGGGAYSNANLLRPYKGYGLINQNTTAFHDQYHSLQMSFNRRFRNGIQFGVNWTESLSLTGNTGLQQRLQHNADGSYTLRGDQAQYEALNNNLNLQRHLIKANWVWDLPDVKAEDGAMKVVGYIVNDWQLSGILTAGSASHYDLGFGYNANGTATNLTGSPDYNARIVYVGAPGTGCSSNQYQQFNTASVIGPTYNSVGLESGRNILQGCPDHTTDLAIARNFRLGGSKQVQIRFDMFNAFNTIVYSARQSTVTYNDPVNQVIQNPQYLADGSLNPARNQPQTAGFGGVTGAQTTRNAQLTARFSF
jgi:hypothetical protein